MASLDRPVVKPRPVYLNLFHIRQPVPAVVSILHRISGALLFVAAIPLLLWIVQGALASPEGWERMRAALSNPFAKIVLVVLAWAYFHHLFAGIRHVVLDLHVGMTLPPARRSAAIALVLALVLALGVAIKLW